MTNSKAIEILKSFEISTRIDETSNSTPEWQSDHDGGGLGLVEGTNIRTSSANRATKDKGGLMNVREGPDEYVFQAFRMRSQVKLFLRKKAKSFLTLSEDMP